MSLRTLFTALVVVLLALATLSARASSLPIPPAPPLDARSWLLLDTASGVALVERNADARVEPASLTKLMTAYLTFSAIKEGRLRLDQTLPVSERAWRAPGSRMFLDPRRPARVEDLLRGMIIQSGNDACIVLAEAIAGSEEGFAAMMNQMAQRLGMTRTRFQNSTGLPHPEHYTTARDMARLASALINTFPEYFRLYAEREFTYNGIRQPNRNRLLHIDPSVDGMKTGHTESAGYCLVATGRREQRRLLSVVMGARSDVARATESQKLLNYGFQFFETVRLYAANQPVTRLRLYKGSRSELPAGFTRDLYVTVPRGSAGRIQARLATQQPMLAPVQRGSRVGSVRLTVDGRLVGDYPLLALQDVPVAGFLGRTWDSLLLLFR